VTIEDIIEELVGEIQDEYDEEVPIVERVSDFEYRVNGAAPVSDANDYMPFRLPEGEDYETVGGFVTMIYGHIPEDSNEIAEFNEYEIRVLEKSDRRVEWVLFTIKEDFRSQIQPQTEEPA
jgi:CBS domain containing-hemolysin-like protein